MPPKIGTCAILLVLVDLHQLKYCWNWASKSIEILNQPSQRCPKYMKRPHSHQSLHPPGMDVVSNYMRDQNTHLIMWMVNIKKLISSSKDIFNVSSILLFNLNLIERKHFNKSYLYLFYVLLSKACQMYCFIVRHSYIRLYWNKVLSFEVKCLNVRPNLGNRRHMCVEKISFYLDEDH